LKKTGDCLGDGTSRKGMRNWTQNHMSSFT
jgi:hypothetical protein